MSAQTTGIGIGNAVAVAVSYTAYHSIGWAILDGVLGWFYILYRVL